MIYDYTKTNVNLETLEFEIGESSVITTELQSTTFSIPDVLKVNFDLTLSQAEETELDSIVSSHAGQSLNGYRFYCVDCTDYRAVRRKTTPIICPVCEGTNINDIVEHYPPTISTKDELGQVWNLFILSDGTIITARRY